MTAVREGPLKAPFPWFGGKGRVADLVWARLGDVQNYVEPFAGSLATLLRRPAAHLRRAGRRVETVNDANHYLVNFWRAVAADPEAVARHAEWPVTEADLHARHNWLLHSAPARAWRERMSADPDCWDAKVAGWWVWGQSCWIGAGWCFEAGPKAGKDAQKIRPRLDHGRGVNAAADGGSDLHKKLPIISGGGRGVNAEAPGMRRPIPHLGGGMGVTNAVRKPIPELAGGRGAVGKAARGDRLLEWMAALSERLRGVRVCYGGWDRVCDSDSTMTGHGITGVFLDPPYPARRADTGEASRDGHVYATDAAGDLDRVRDGVLAWCLKWGPDPRARVAVCGYEGDGYEPLAAAGWAEHAWEATGGYGNQRRGEDGRAAGKELNANAKRERIWFSPACKTPPKGPTLFDPGW